MSTNGRFDALFATLAQQHDGVEALLDSFFDFMHRKTDFYVVTSDPAKRKMGFLPGHAQQKVLRAFLKYPFKYLDGSLASVASSSNDNSSNKSTVVTKTKALKEEKVPISASLAPVRSQESSANSAAATQPATAAAATGVKSERPTRQVKRTESGKQLPVGNGGSTKTYTWTQNLDETTIYVEVPPGTRSRDLECKITATHVRVALKSAVDAADAKPLLDGDFPEKIRSDESVWSLESGSSTLQIALEKIKKTWWASALTGDDEIDTSQVDSKREMHEYDDETQGAIRKALFDQQQQQMGLPTSDEMRQKELLGQARRVPNSPI